MGKRSEVVSWTFNWCTTITFVLCFVILSINHVECLENKQSTFEVLFNGAATLFNAFRNDTVKASAQTNADATSSTSSWISFILDYALPANMTHQCKADILYVFESVMTYRHGGPLARWALRGIDAFGKLPTGLMEGDFHWIGRYDECLSLEVRKAGNESEVIDFRGKYCLVLIVLVQPDGKVPPIVPKLGTCFPSTCTEVDISYIMNYYLHIGPVQVAVADQFCHIRGVNEPWKFRNYFSSFVLGSLIFLVIVGTIIDVVKGLLPQHRHNTANKSSSSNKKPSSDNNKMPKSSYERLEPFILTFSAKRNVNSIFNTNDRKEQVMECLNGIRFLTAVWVIVVHVVVIGVQDFPWKNILKMSELGFQNFFVQIVPAATFSSDTFFMLSGLVVTFVFLKAMLQSNLKFHLIIFYLHRYLRTTPAYAITILIMAGVYYPLGSGPLWPLITESCNKCAENWWKNILYIHNLWGDFYDQCLLPSWYLAVDFQMFLVTPIFLLPLYKKPKLGLTLMGIGLFLTVIVPGFLVYKYDLESYTGRGSRADNLDRWTNMIYNKPWNRMASYFIGMFLGYILYQHYYEKNIKLSKKTVAVGWSFNTFMLCFIVFGPYKYYKGEVMTSLMFTVYGALARPFWAIGIAWIVFACSIGHGGIVNGILTWKVFMPLGRLSFCLYLIHIPVLHFLFYTYEDSIYISINAAVLFMIGVTFVCVLFALFLSLIAEAPALQLQKMLVEDYLLSNEKNSQSGTSLMKNYPEKYKQSFRLVPYKNEHRSSEEDSVRIRGSSARRRF